MDFARIHGEQLQALNIPPALYDPLVSQLHRVFAPSADGGLNLEILLDGSTQNMSSLSEESSSSYGSMLVFPHVCSWDILQEPSRGMFNALNELPLPVLQKLLIGLKKSWREDCLFSSKTDLINQICDPRTWSRVILYRHESSVRAALPAPPYFNLPQLELQSETDETEADVTGPFPFQYHMVVDGKEQIITCSLGYVSPGISFAGGRFPTLDLVPAYSAPNTPTRHVRYAALLGTEAPDLCVQTAKTVHSNFVHNMHLVRQQKLAADQNDVVAENSSPSQSIASEKRVWKVYTDPSDGMKFTHPEAGLTSPFLELTEDPEQADFIFSFQSLYAPSELKQLVDRRPDILINQFPYEGAFVQKDHLAREILKQHGLPRPNWAIETYDLDVQLGEFVGAELLATDRGEKPVWIIKPAGGTRSQGHVVTRGTAQVLRLIDAGGGSRVAQRYIENPLCYEGKKIDCRCIVMMTSADPQGRPTLYMHNRVFFRIASKKHSISTPSDLVDNQSVLTAMYLLGESDELGKIPVDHKVIAQLEEEYKHIGFDWEHAILPRIHTMIRELFNGMTKSYPAMNNSRCRALYGVDVMFEIASGVVEPKLTEISFCPANNAVGDNHERDEQLYRNYNNDIFSCMFLNECSDTITKLQ